jgi:lipid II:glycine glycyltransferase (peptidoglycan interpeptide bridge formation enzyme)
MIIKEIENKEIWENSIQSQPEYTFLHSWNWGSFNLAMGNKIWRLGIYDGKELAGVALVVGIQAKRGKFLFMPHALLAQLTDNNKQLTAFNFLIDYLKDLAGKEGCSFIRISPLLERNEENLKLFQSLGFRRAPIHMHAESTLLLDITKTEEELLKNMRKTTRYLVRKMEKEGVVIEKENPLSGDSFLKLQDKVAERKHFSVFSKKQIMAELDSFCSDNQLIIFNARYKNEVIASALIVFYGYRAFYYQSASYTEHKNISAPYLVVWRAINEAKKRGCKLFDFYGASPADKPNHPWAGPTLFKQGFGSYRVNYLTAQDLVLDWRYWITFLIETARRIKRGF